MTNKLHKLSTKTTMNVLNAFLGELAVNSKVKASVVVNLTMNDVFIEGQSHSPMSLRVALTRWLNLFGIEQEISTGFANKVVNDGSTLMLTCLCEFDATHEIKEGYFYLPTGTKLFLVDVDHHRSVEEYVVKKKIIIRADPVLISLDLDEEHRVFFESDGLGERCRWLGKKQTREVSYLPKADILTGEVIGGCSKISTLIYHDEMVDLHIGKWVSPGTKVNFSKSKALPLPQ